MHTQSLTVEMPDGCQLHCLDYFPEQPAHSGVVFMHGLGEHSGRYARLAAFFCERGFAVRTYDHRGHGQSSGKRGDIPHANALLDDANDIIRHWQVSCPQTVKQQLLLGHSMGGLFAAQLALTATHSFDGLVLSAPALAIYMNVIERALLKVLTSIAPGLTLSNGLKTQYLSHDTEVVTAYRNDDLVHDRISARLLNSMLETMATVQAQAPSLNLPTLLLVAGEDKLVDSSGSLAFAQASPSDYLRLHSYETLYHEIFNEIDSAKVFNDLGAWLDTLPSKAA